MTIYDVADQFKRELRDLTQDTTSDIVRAYGNIWQQLNSEILRLTRQYYDDTRGISAQAWLQELGRLNILQAQVERELRTFAATASANIVYQQQEAIRMAGNHAFEMVDYVAERAGISMIWNRLDTDRLEQMVGMLQYGSPLSKILYGYGEKAGKTIGDSIITGIAMGIGPREIARNIRLEMAGDLSRAMRIARTEIVRASREASREIYKANPDIVGGYIRRSARSERTCAACWALDGEKYPVDQPLDDHPNGLCYEVPYLPDAADMYNLDDTGSSAFEKLSDEQKQAILGPVKFEGFKQGLFGLKDLVGHTHSDDWGDGIQEKSLSSLLGDEKAKELITDVLHGGGENKEQEETMDAVLARFNDIVQFKNGVPDFSNLELGMAKDISKAYEDIISKYPQLKGKFDQIEAKALGQTYARAHMNGSGSIEININYYKDASKLETSYNKDVSTGFHPAGTTYKSVITHEIGHVIDDLISTSGHGTIVSRGPYAYPKLTNASTYMRREVLKSLKLTKSDIIKGVSSYAAKNDLEFFAECFAEYMTSKNPRPMAAKFGEILNDWIKDVKP
jgi:hypothetical protein